MIRPLRNPVFLRLFLAQITSLFGTGLSTVALALLAYKLAGGDSGAILGTALAIKMIVYVFLSPLAGALARRFPRKTGMVLLDLARAGVVLLFPGVDAAWQIFLLIFLLNSCSALFTPTFQALIPDILPDEEDYTRAISLSRIAYDLENLLSPLIAAGLLVLLSFEYLFVLNALTFLVSALLVLSLRLPAAESGDDFDRPDLLFGIRSYLRTPRLRVVLLLSLAVAAGGAMVIVNTVVYVKGSPGGTESLAALAFAFLGAGSILVAATLPRLLAAFSESALMLTGGFLIAVAVAAWGLAPPLIPFFGLTFLLGMGLSLVQTPIGRVVRDSCQAGDRPEFFAAQFSLAHLCWLLTYPLAGWAGRLFDIPTTGWLLAGLAGLATLAAWFVSLRAVEGKELWHRHEAIEHSHRHEHDIHHRHDHVEADEPHHHRHEHQALIHRHRFTIDRHHRYWPDRALQTAGGSVKYF